MKSIIGEHSPSFILHLNLTIKGVRTSLALPGSKTGILGALWRRFEKQKQTSQISEL